MHRFTSCTPIRLVFYAVFATVMACGSSEPVDDEVPVEEPDADAQPITEEFGDEPCQNPRWSETPPAVQNDDDEATSERD